MLPIQQPDVWTKATAAEKDQALTSMASLPARSTDNPEMGNAAYHIALEDVTRYALAECVRGVFQNKLGHTFFPSPPEMRRLCDLAMLPHERQRERAWRQHKLEQESAQFRKRTVVSPEAKARSLQSYQEFCASYEQNKISGDEAERVRIRAEFGMTEEALSQVPNAPNSFGQIGSR